MTQPETGPTWIPKEWRPGVRVSRLDSKEGGTIVAADGEIRVKWDSGRTSYYRRKVPTNIRIET